ncbi:MAG: endolytic transglycosylase MltG, partial [Pseudomonadales bacterium]|nr:endolytic transglycosylase MltG [Pseudomonadales bacterium]
SIRAALHPDPGEFLFFVAKGDGTSYFSDNLEEHNAAVEQYQRSGRRADYQSNPQ